MTHTFKVHQFHLVWSTKNRRNFIEKSFQKRLYDYMREIIKKHKGYLLEIGGITNHVHLLIIKFLMILGSFLDNGFLSNSFLAPLPGRISFYYLNPGFR
ncbi:MAG: transposase [Parachlamydiaceae bacterium]|nr:transposase [Parachlamydiaceae bacterium]